jgi:Nucleotidyl transferase AbiEii toxin, Type IV TA system
LQGLFASEIGQHLVFKGGTSLSKGYGIIQRFSEDVDLTYDIRQIIPDLAKGNPPIPENNSQANKWTKAARERLTNWVKDVALPVLEKHAKGTGADVTFRVENDVIYVDYTQLAQGSAYVAPGVKLEFGARSTGEPAEERAIVCDAAAHLPDVEFPTAKPRVMLPKRTFWEKTTAIHVFCAQGLEGDRLSRHWYDIVRLDDKGIAQEAFDDAALAKEVADWKAKFFRARDGDGNPINYHAAVRATRFGEGLSHNSGRADKSQRRNNRSLPRSTYRCSLARAFRHDVRNRWGDAAAGCADKQDRGRASSGFSGHASLPEYHHQLHELWSGDHPVCLWRVQQ